MKVQHERLFKLIRKIYDELNYNESRILRLPKHFNNTYIGNVNENVITLCNNNAIEIYKLEQQNNRIFLKNNFLF